MDEIIKIIKKALNDLYLNDSILISRFTKEEAINHWLAIYLDKYISENSEFKYNVDVEYNRNITNEFFDENRQNNKKVIKWGVDGIKWKEIIPDIIAHKRGSNEYNYLCVEVKKKYKSNNAANKDLQKIIGLLNAPFNFKYGCIIEYLPDEEFFEIIIISKTNYDYQTERILINKPSI